MLKIKDDVDLKELEKFGFKKEGCTYEVFFGDAVIWVGNDKKVYFSTIDYFGDETGDDVLEFLFDLIQAGLVEKVRE